MLEAIIYYLSGRRHTVEANTLEMLKEKCKPFIEDEKVHGITVQKVETLGYLKCEGMSEEDLL